MLIIALALMASEPLTPDPYAPPPKPVAVKASVKDDPKQVICRDLETTGSRVSFRQECHSREEWRAMSDEASRLPSSRNNGGGENGLLPDSSTAAAFRK